MNVKIVYAVMAILVISVCGITGYSYGYNISPCEALDISLTDAGIIAFLDSTNMATGDVYNCKNYQGHNTWLVCWHTKTQSQRVYVDIYSGEIVGTGPDPKPCWHTVNTFQGRHDKRTPSFAIKGDTWRINWETVGREDTSSIAVTVYKELMYNEWVDHFSQDTFPFGADTYCVYEGAGTFYLCILADDLEYWSIAIEDFY